MCLVGRFVFARGALVLDREDCTIIDDASHLERLLKSNRKLLGQNPSGRSRGAAGNAWNPGASPMNHLPGEDMRIRVGPGDFLEAPF